MDFEETTVNEATEAEDSLPEGLVEDTGETEEELETVLTDEADEGNQEEAEADKGGSEGRKEPGYVQGRISKAVEKAVAETEARFTAQMQALEAKYAPIRERLLEMDAQELVRKGEVKNIEIAKELIRARQGLPPQPAEDSKSGQPRQANGQFASKDSVSADNARIEGRFDVLRKQIEKIKAKTGLDVVAECNKNEDLKNKVIKGEMDFYDVADALQKPKKRPPSPMRSPNGASGTSANAIESMSDAQFERLEQRIKEGVRYTLR